MLSNVRDHQSWSLNYKPLLNSMSAKLIDQDGDTVKIDIVAQIGGKH